MMVIDLKRICSRVLFVGELLVFVWVYLFGVHGFGHLRHLKTDCKQIEQQVNQKQKEADQLKRNDYRLECTSLLSRKNCT